MMFLRKKLLPIHKIRIRSGLLAALMLALGGFLLAPSRPFQNDFGSGFVAGFLSGTAWLISGWYIVKKWWDAEGEHLKNSFREREGPRSLFRVLRNPKNNKD